VIQRVKQAARAFPEKFGEAWLPCLYFMVEGQISKLTWKHLVVAYNTGLRTAIVYSFCILFFKRVSIAQNVFLTGVFTFFCDLATHPTHFGYWWTEALATAVSACALALLFQLTVGKIRVSQ